MPESLCGWDLRGLPWGWRAKLQFLRCWYVLLWDWPDQRVNLPVLRNRDVLAERGQHLLRVFGWDVRDRSGVYQLWPLYSMWGWNIWDWAGIYQARIVYYLPDWHVLDWIGHEHRLGMHQLLDLLDWPVQRVKLQQLS
jgi:hypothetical protein